MTPAAGKSAAMRNAAPSASTPGIVNTPVPMMLPITRAVAEGRPSARSRDSAGDDGDGGLAGSIRAGGGGAMATALTCLSARGGRG